MKHSDFCFPIATLSDITGSIMTAPFRYLLEIKRGWSQLNLKLRVTNASNLKLTPFAPFVMRDVAFHIGFGAFYANLIANRENTWNMIYLKMAVAVSMGVVFSQVFDLIFIRQSMERVQKYSGFSQTVKDISSTEGYSRLFSVGMRYRFLYKFIYYGFLSFTARFNEMHKHTLGIQSMI